MITSVTSENFNKEVLNSELPVLVDFWADWCGPCKMFAPVIDEFATEHNGSVKVCKVNIDEEMGLAEQFGIMSIPTVVVFKNGSAEDSRVGVISKTELCALAGL